MTLIIPSLSRQPASPTPRQIVFRSAQNVADQLRVSESRRECKALASRWKMLIMVFLQEQVT